MKTIVDTVGAFCPGGLFTLQGSAEGPLHGLNFGAKDLYDVVGHRTGAGNPTWLADHPPAIRNAAAVQTLLDAGACLVGKTLTDELAYSINGDNVHYGTPRNSKAPGRFPGGSSSGSASAVAAGLVDFALGSDSGGSNRIPASYCGLIGMRSTHGRISLEGAVPLMPSFDTVGWFADDIEIFDRVGAVLLGEEHLRTFDEIIVLQDAFEECNAEVRSALDAAAARVLAHAGRVRECRIAPEGLEKWRLAYRAFSASETWKIHGDWITRARPDFSPAIRERFIYAASVSEADARAARAVLEGVRARIRNLVGEGAMLLSPTAPGMAPLLETSDADIEDFRQRAQRLTCIAGIGGLPELSLPLVSGLAAPLNLSLIGDRHSDRSLIAAAKPLLGAR